MGAFNKYLSIGIDKHTRELHSLDFVADIYFRRGSFEDLAQTTMRGKLSDSDFSLHSGGFITSADNEVVDFIDLDIDDNKYVKITREGDVHIIKFLQDEIKSINLWSTGIPEDIKLVFESLCVEIDVKKDTPFDLFFNGCEVLFADDFKKLYDSLGKDAVVIKQNIHN